MPPIREHDVVYDGEDDDDDDMPPLVDHPIPSMEYTFLADINTSPLNTTDSGDSAITFPSTSILPESSLSVFASTPPDSPLSPDDASSNMPPASNYRGSHGKKRDASYIPRPPNAFILFRSSFIRSQQVTGKVEGNHSNLSKIIGMYWKTLPREEREAWEAKAVIAQAEHRKRYPDWRFRPGANAMARLKFKDGGGGGPTRRGRAQAKDPPDRGGGDDDEPEVEDFGDDEMSGKAKGKAVPKVRERKTKTKKETEKEKRAAQRYAKITDLLVEGKKGAELETAIAKWEKETKGRGDKARDRDKPRNTETPQEVLTSTVEQASTSHTRSSSSVSPFPANQPRLSIPDNPIEPTATCLTPDTASDSAVPPPSATSETYYDRPFDNEGDKYGGRRSRSRSPEHPLHYHDTSLGKIPLTHMFKRSLSAPAPQHRLSYPSGLQAAANPAGRNHPLRQVTMPMDTPPTPYDATGHLASHHAHAPGPGHVRRDTISLPVHSSDYSFTHSHHQHDSLRAPDNQHLLSWQEEEDRRRLENAQEHGYWWTGSAEEDEDEMYEPQREGSFEMGYNVNTEGMGYDQATTSSFDQAYLEGFPAHPVNHIPRDASHGVNWTNVPGRQGLVAVVQDPFMHPKRSSGSSTPSSKTPPPPIPVPIPASSPIRPLSPNTNPDLLHSIAHDPQQDYDYYPPYTSVSSLAPHSPVPASTFSTLTGWDGMSESTEASGSRDRPSPWVDSSGSAARWDIQPLGLRGGLREWNEGQREDSRIDLESAGQSDRGRKVTFEDERGQRYRYRSPGEGNVQFGNSGVGMGVGIGLTRDVDRGLGIPYDDEDEADSA